MGLFLFKGTEEPARPSHCSVPLISSGRGESVLGSPAASVTPDVSILEPGAAGEETIGMSCVAHTHTFLLHRSTSGDELDSGS